MPDGLDARLPRYPIRVAEWEQPRPRPDVASAAVAAADLYRWACGPEIRGTIVGNAAMVVLAELAARWHDDGLSDIVARYGVLVADRVTMVGMIHAPHLDRDCASGECGHDV